MKKSDKIRERILLVAIKLFSKEGFDATTFELIARKCRVSATTPYYYFKNKRALIDAAIIMILQHNSELVSQTIDPNDGALERLNKHFRMNLSWAEAYPQEAQVVLLMYYLATFDQTWAETYERILTGARRKILEHLLAGQREKVFHFTLPAETVAEILHDALLGGIVNQISTQLVRASAKERSIEKWKALLENVVKGSAA